jgi:hypothetical protein
VAAALLAGCASSDPDPGPEPGAGPPTHQEARDAAAEAARLDRERVRGMTFEEYEATVYKESFPGGKYIVNGDTAIADRKHLRDFFEALQREPAAPAPAPAEFTAQLIVHQVGGLDAVWNSTVKQALTYCVSTAFGPQYNNVVADMAAATQAWEQVAAVNFIHLTAQDGSCTASNASVVFDVRPVNVNGQYLARAFFPNDLRPERNVLIDNSSFELDPGGTLQLTGILRHELGHTLGFRHEHTRPESGACYEDDNWRPLTNYDAFSVMHYPQCNGLGDWSLTLTSADQTGAACLYQPAPGFPHDPAACQNGGSPAPTPTPGTPVTVSFNNQSVTQGQQLPYGPFAVAAGTRFDAQMTGRSPPGDPDLYVRFDDEPTTTQYDCRPYLSTADERCAVDVPAGKTQAFVMVRGYQAGRFDLRITHTPAATTMTQVAN